MLCLFVALQTMAPFIHAHAGAVQLSHGGVMHGHQNVHSDAACHTIVAHEHGADVVVILSRPMRNAQPGVANDALPAVNRAALPCPVEATRLHGADRSASLLRPVNPDHALPHALAPPSA